MPIQQLIQQIAWATTMVSLISTGVFALSYGIGYLLRGAPIPFREWKEYGQGLVTDAIKSAFMAMLYSSVIALISWIITIIASAA